VNDPIPVAPTAGTPAAASVEQYLTFELAGELYAIPILAVQEIRGWEPVAKIPQTPPHVLGVIDLRGAVVPVVDLRTRLSIERRETTSTTVVIVVRIEAAPGAPVTVGIVVDAVSDVANIDDASVRPAPSVCGDVDAHFLRGLSTIETRLVMLLDLSRLIDVATVAPAAARAA
jgi:purine-binding chemotaxis protein CheW